VSSIVVRDNAQPRWRSEALVHGSRLPLIVVVCQPRSRPARSQSRVAFWHETPQEKFISVLCLQISSTSINNSGCSKESSPSGSLRPSLEQSELHTALTVTFLLYRLHYSSSPRLFNTKNSPWLRLHQRCTRRVTLLDECKFTRLNNYQC
jgi:hypothetical protein